MSTEIYDELEWDISPLPIGSSTPDELFELSYDATAQCPNCNGIISGTAYYWSENDDMSNMWLNHIDYDDCGCEIEDEDDDEEDNDFIKYLKSLK